ncbi:MAG: DUF503 domain-containing protein [Candidatus Bipolaricaulia bacterium]
MKLLTIDLFLPGCASLKDKRFILSSLKTRLRQRLNVAVSEVDFQEKWQRCRLAVVTVGESRRVADAGCDRALALIAKDHRVEVLDSFQEVR